jgi:poly(A) polymerase
LVNSQDSDVDTVCVVPKFINRDDHFFNILYKILKEKKGIENLFRVQDTLVPLMKLTYFNIQFDIVFARIDQNSVSNELNLSSNKILINMDEKSIRSFNGYRVAKYL